MIHPHNLGVARTEHALRRWAWLTGVRVVYYLLLVGIAALAVLHCHSPWWPCSAA